LSHNILSNFDFGLKACRNPKY